MRITNNMLSYNLLRNLEAAQGRMDQLQNQMSSGLRISRPSDDPVGIENALRLKSTISKTEQWKANAGEGLTYMDTIDSALGDMTSMLQRAKELTIQGANGSMSEDDRKKVALEINQIKGQIVQLANTKVGSKYIFGGTANVEPLPYKEPFAKDATKWLGSDDIMKFEVGNNFSLEISVNGKDLFGVTANAGGSNDTIGMLKALEDLQNALNTSDMNTIQDSITKLEEQADNVVNFRAELGARQNRMDSIYNQLDATVFNLTKNISDIMDADIAKTLVDFKSQENVYRAALSMGAKIIQPSLVDFMN